LWFAYEIYSKKEPVLKLLLFDLDGTLMLSGGAGDRAMSRAFLERWGVEGAFRGIIPDGKTDPMIFREIMRTRGIPAPDEKKAIGELAEIYERHLAVEMPASPDARIMPGVVELLEALSKRRDVHLGLLTGNFEKTARIKLARFDLNRFFLFGAFASDSEIRAELVPIAVAKAEAHIRHKIGLGRHIVVIGDTPLDIRCALDNEVTAVGVASAHFTKEQLLAAGPHLCFDDLSDTAGVLAALETV
jgi:phosphoglycolate phosphatase-like HAD superfamily hydrolase